MSAPTALLPPAAVDAMGSLELRLASPVERLRMQIARLEESLRIQRDARDSLIVQMRNPAQSELERAAAEGSFRTAAWEVAALRRQLREAKAELAVAVRFREAASTCRMLSTQSAWLAPGEYDRLLDAQDEMAMCRCQLEQAGRLDLIGGGV